MKYTKQCPYCNEEFETDMPFKKYCCEEHSYIYSFGKVRGFKGENLKCKECGESFTQKKANQKYCKSECGKDYYYRQQYGRDRPKLQIIECKECGREFKQRVSRHVFCGRRCSDKFKRKEKNKIRIKKKIKKIYKKKEIKISESLLERIVEGLDNVEGYKELIKKEALEINQPKDDNIGNFPKKIEEKNEKLKKLSKVIKDLLSNPNDLLLKKSKLKIIGFTPREFYEKYILVSGGYKPEIIWTKDINNDLIKYQKTLKQIEYQKRLIKDLFYNSEEWMLRSNEISARDNEKCVYCGRKCHTVHHKKSACYNPVICLDPNNLITVCKRCENEIHYN